MQSFGSKLLLTSSIVVFISTMVVSIYPEIPCNEIYTPSNCENKTWESLESVEDFAKCAPAKLPPLTRDYIWSGAGRQRTIRENEEAFKRIRIKSRVLRDVSRKKLSTKVLGKFIEFPIAISPTAGQHFAYPGGDAATARAAWNMGTISVLSSYASTPLEEVAAAVPPEANIWMQLYIFQNKSSTVQLVKRAEKAGFKALVLTVDDVAMTGVRCSAKEKIFELFMKNRGLPNVDNPSVDSSNPSLTSRDISWLKQITKLPIIVKGVMTGEDALSVIRAGASAIFVSNHGGRQLDGTVSTIDALPDVVDRVRRWYPFIDIYIDGGIYNGYDVYKAIARGATAAFIGRANIWGLTMGGENGAKRVLSILRKEFEDAMLHAGFNNPREITRNSIIPPKPNFLCSI